MSLGFLAAILTERLARTRIGTSSGAAAAICSRRSNFASARATDGFVGVARYAWNVSSDPQPYLRRLERNLVYRELRGQPKREK